MAKNLFLILVLLSLSAAACSDLDRSQSRFLQNEGLQNARHLNGNLWAAENREGLYVLVNIYRQKILSTEKYFAVYPLGPKHVAVKTVYGGTNKVAFCGNEGTVWELRDLNGQKVQMQYPNYSYCHFYYMRDQKEIWGARHLFDSVSMATVL
ncbi:hypothetical protein HN958_00010 [Candidatus Falkowbacteria bacterium]|jgi:hypothetical protein|nr:hypothetical protein [Candidatus Falkowbacteria bacterium]MBT7006871.1 hypothetical protein [Candidatus Falkowbacteria bacterium]